MFLLVRNRFDGIPLGLDLGQPRVVRPVRGARAVVAFLLGEEVDVGAAGRELAQVAPGAPRPLDVRGVVVGCSHALAMLRTAAASRLPTAEWSSGSSFSAPSSGKIRIAECGETIRDACSIARVKSAGSSARRYSDFQ